MNRNDERLELVRLYVEGIATAEETRSLEAAVCNDADFRHEFLRYLNIEAALGSGTGIGQSNASPECVSDNRHGGSGDVRRLRRRAAVAVLVASSLLVVGLIAGWWWQASHPHGDEHLLVARFGSLEDCEWIDSRVVAEGERLRRGENVELHAGRAEIVFDSGAIVTLSGPCLFEVESQNAGRLVLGRITALAETAESKGFVVTTRTARIVDLGTEFTAESSPDGHSRIGVLTGEVQVHLNNSDAPHFLRAGDIIEIEPGKTRITARIEQGEDTPEFRFPTIEPPSKRDDADQAQGHAVARVLFGKLERESGLPTVLLNGVGQSNHDAPGESVYFANDEVGGLLVDLGEVKPIAKVNSYSWHRSRGNEVDRVRATQKFKLYGTASDTLPATESSQLAAEWQLIARVDSNEYFGLTRQNRPAQQASSITSANGSLGRYRYLLWVVEPTRDHGDLNNTFYGELDVYVGR